MKGEAEGPARFPFRSFVGTAVVAFGLSMRDAWLLTRADYDALIAAHARIHDQDTGGPDRPFSDDEIAEINRAMDEAEREERTWRPVAKTSSSG